MFICISSDVSPAMQELILKDTIRDLTPGDCCTIMFETETTERGALTATIKDKGREPSASISIEGIDPGTDDLFADEPEFSGEGCLSYLEIPRDDLGVVTLILDHLGTGYSSITEVYPTGIVTQADLSTTR